MPGELLSIRTLVCIPEEQVADKIINVLSSYSDFEALEPCENGLDAVESITTNQPSLVFVDTDLPDMSGFDLIHRLYPVHVPQFIFVSKNDKLAVKAFEYFAFDYLLKPLVPERLHLSLMKFKEGHYQRSGGKIQEKLNALFRYVSGTGANGHEKKKEVSNGSNIIPVKMGGRIYFVKENEIQYIVASGYYIEIYANGKKHLLRQSLRGIAEKLDSKQFIRIHRSVIISLKFLKEITRQGASDFSARMEDGTSFRISKSYKGEVFEHIGIGS